MPKKPFSSVPFLSACICTIALILSYQLFSPFEVSLCLKNIQSVDLNCSLVLLNLSPLTLAVSHRVKKLALCCASNWPCMMMSCAIPTTLGTSLSTLFQPSWNASDAILSPEGSCNHLNLPHGVLNVVGRLLWISSITCQYPVMASSRDIVLALKSCGITSSIVLMYQAFLLIALFKSLGSRHSLISPFGFYTGTIELAHFV